MKRLIILVFASFLSFPALGSGGGEHLEKANNDLSNLNSLQRGARLYVNYCLGCHSLQYVRYDRIGKDLKLSEEQLMDNLMFTALKPTELMDIAMPADDAERWFGRTPPDLSLIARSRGSDWLYSYMRGFYLDPTRPMGVNNIVLDGANMPHVLSPLQGFRKAEFSIHEDELGNITEKFEGFVQVTEGSLSEEEYDLAVRDLVNFLDYVGEPVQLQRTHIGIGVLAFLFVFFLFAFFLKRDYWKDVH